MNEGYTIDAFVGNKAYGDVASALMRQRMDLGNLRPWIGEDGHSYIVQNAWDKERARVVRVANANATLLRDEWLHIDKTVVSVIQKKLNLIENIKKIGTFKIPNGMGTTVLTWQRSTDISDAVQSMDGMRRSMDDDQEYDTVYMPVPIFHKDFSFSLREIEETRRRGQPIDDSMAADCAEKVAIMMEKQFAGAITGMTYGPTGSTVYGLMTHPDRNTKTLTAPTGSNGTTTFAEVLDMIQKLKDDGFDGPYDAYYSSNWFQYLHQAYSTTLSEGTLFQKLNTIPEVAGNWKQANYLVNSTKFIIVLVQKSPTTIKAVNALGVKVIQWESHGGWRQHFKVVGSILPQIRSTITGQCGICHGSN
jgi:uncharacterized linocin/CFP29 family protein